MRCNREITKAAVDDESEVGRRGEAGTESLRKKREKERKIKRLEQID